LAIGVPLPVDPFTGKGMEPSAPAAQFREQSNERSRADADLRQIGY
jgi:hypothetical protein